MLVFTKQYLLLRLQEWSCLVFKTVCIIATSVSWCGFDYAARNAPREIFFSLVSKNKCHKISQKMTQKTSQKLVKSDVTFKGRYKSEDKYQP